MRQKLPAKRMNNEVAEVVEKYERTVDVRWNAPMSPASPG
jgi:hypothetical protein